MLIALMLPLMAACSLDRVGSAEVAQHEAPAVLAEVADSEDFDVITSHEAFGSAVTLTLGGELIKAPAGNFSFDVPVEAGVVQVRSIDGELVLEQLELHLGDIVVPAQESAPNGLHTTDLKVTLAQTVAMTTHTEGDEVVATADTAFQMSWNVMTATGKAPLADQQLAAIPLTVRLEHDADGELELKVAVAADGSLWQFGELLELQGVGMNLKAVN